MPGLENSAFSGPSRQTATGHAKLARCGRATEGPGGYTYAGGRAAVKTAELCLQVIEACVHECDLGAESCDDRRIRQAIG